MNKKWPNKFLDQKKKMKSRENFDTKNSVTYNLIKKYFLPLKTYLKLNDITGPKQFMLKFFCKKTICN